MLVYYARVSLEDGYNLMGEPKESRLVNGRAVSLASGAKLFQHMISSGQPMKCWNCGIEASCFIANKGQNDKVGPPVLDLYAEVVGSPVLMTRDHIIPKSYGGINDIANLRIGCGPCNHGRGNELEADDIAFLRAHPELIGPKPKYVLADDEHTFVAKITEGPKPQRKINTPEEAAANKKAKAKAKRQRQKAKRHAKAEQPYITMMALALA